MRKIICDWCGADIPFIVLSAKLQRRIALTSNEDAHKLNLVIEIEPLDNNATQDVCKQCLSNLISRAAAALLTEKEFDDF
jgi:hypothetical protein